MTEQQNSKKKQKTETSSERLVTAAVRSDRTASEIKVCMKESSAKLSPCVHVCVCVCPERNHYCVLLHAA